MIRRFNRRSLGRATVAFLLSLTGYGLAAAFVWVVGRLIGVDSRWLPLAIAAFLLVITWSGWRQWREGLAAEVMGAGLPFAGLDGMQGGVFLLQWSSGRVTAPALVLSRIFLAGPLQALKAGNLLRHRLPQDPQLEQQLHDLLTRVQAKGSWHALETWKGNEAGISALIRMGKIDFSALNGRLRAAP